MTDSRPRDLAGHTSRYDHDKFAKESDLTDATEPLWSAVNDAKQNIESIEAELELLAKTLEHGEWSVAANAAVRPGQMHLAATDLSAQQNQLTINNTDTAGKTHGWATLDVGDYVELLQEESVRSISHDYGLYVVKAVNPGNGILMLDLELYQAQGDAVAGDLFEVRVLDIAESNLDMAALDERYANKTHTHDDLASKEHPHDDLAPKVHAHDDLASKDHAHDDLASKEFVDLKLEMYDAHTHPYAPSVHGHEGSYASINHTHDDLTSGSGGLLLPYHKTIASPDPTELPTSTRLATDIKDTSSEKYFIYDRSANSGVFGFGPNKKILSTCAIAFKGATTSFYKRLPFWSTGALVGCTSAGPPLKYALIVFDVFSTEDDDANDMTRLLGHVSWMRFTDPDYVWSSYSSPIYWWWVGPTR